MRPAIIRKKMPKGIPKTEVQISRANWWMMLSITIPSSLGLVALFTVKSPIDDFLYYQQLLSTIIMGIFGSLVLLTMFYLGKMHDYDKNFLKVFSENNHLNQICENLLEILSTSIESIKEKTKNSDDPKIRSVNNHFTAMNKSVDRLAKNVERRKLLTESEKSKIRLEESRRTNFKMFIRFGIFFALLFLFAHITYNETYGILLYFLAMLVSGILSLLILWHSNENTMSVSHMYYKILLKVHVSFKNDIFWLKYYIREIQITEENVGAYER